MYNICLPLYAKPLPLSTPWISHLQLVPLPYSPIIRNSTRVIMGSGQLVLWYIPAQTCRPRHLFIIISIIFANVSVPDAFFMSIQMHYSVAEEYAIHEYNCFCVYPLRHVHKLRLAMSCYRAVSMRKGQVLRWHIRR